MFSYHEAKQRCAQFGYELFMRDGMYHVQNRYHKMVTDDLDEAVAFASGRMS